MMWKVYALAIVAALYGFWMIDYANVRQENKTLVASLKTANRAIVAQNNILMGVRALRKKERDLIDEIERAPAGDDAPTAPVLFNAISRLR